MSISRTWAVGCVAGGNHRVAAQDEPEPNDEPDGTERDEVNKGFAIAAGRLCADQVQAMRDEGVI